MINELTYPFNAEYILKKKKSLKRELLENKASNFIEKRISILGGCTTQDIKLILELFLLSNGIKPSLNVAVAVDSDVKLCLHRNLQKQRWYFLFRRYINALIRRPYYQPSTAFSNNLT